MQVATARTPRFAADGLRASFEATRGRSLRLCETLSAEDQQIQACEEASPTKWHLAHSTWFFEAFLLERFAASYQPFDPVFSHLFNSYYETVGTRHPRAERGLLSRPSLTQVQGYRSWVDQAVQRALAEPLPREALACLELGLHHEQQHQELMLTDILRNFWPNPLRPAWRATADVPLAEAAVAKWQGFEGGVIAIGHEGDGFHFDNEAPRHRTLLAPYRLRSTLLTNAEVLAFIEAGGYSDARLWLSDGIAWVRRNGVTAPGYWSLGPEGWQSFTLYGTRPIIAEAPAVHLSGYEADAIATWLGARLPTEQEWESAVALVAPEPQRGRWLEDGPVLPCATGTSVGSPALRSVWGEAWEWTRSAYAPYPGYRANDGALGEYNGKFMCNQWVLRGGSCATPAGHVRATYRNFFYPSQRWQFAGVRLAKDGS